jgi:hypothetical protein
MKRTLYRKKRAPRQRALQLTLESFLAITDVPLSPNLDRTGEWREATPSHTRVADRRCGPCISRDE